MIFCPHFPALNIRTGGIDKLIMAYKQIFGNSDHTMINDDQIDWKNVRKYIEGLCKLEEIYIKKEHNLRNNKENIKIPEETVEEKYRKFDLIPGFNREVEKFINPFKPNWESRYYKMLFPNFKGNCDKDIKQQIAINYLEGLEWTFKYYNGECIDWRWCYKYHYPPLLVDLIKEVPISEKRFLLDQTCNPVTELVQLCYVLPKVYIHLLPKELKEVLLKNYSHMYKSEEELLWAYCKYFWESHVVFEEWDIQQLETIVNNTTPC